MKVENESNHDEDCIDDVQQDDHEENGFAVQLMMALAT